MKLDRQTVQRLILAFTTGLFLSCASKVAEQPSSSSGFPTMISIAP